MTQQIVGFTLGLPDGWKTWQPSHGSQAAPAIADALAEGETARARVAQAVLAFDAEPREGVVVELGVWVPDRTSGEPLGSLSLELLVEQSGRRVTRDEFLETVRRRPRARGAKVFHYDASPAETNAGPAVIVTHTIAPRRGGQVVVTVQWTVFPPGTSDAMELVVTTPISAVAEALAAQSVTIVNQLAVTLQEA